MPADNLHTLYNSLSKSEKRYLKLFAEMGTGRAHGKTLALLEALKGVSGLDDPKFRQRIDQKGLAAQLPLHKNRLTELILRSLRQKMAGGTLRAQLRQYLADIEILQARGLTKMAQKRLRKAKKLAREFEEYHALQELIALEIRAFPHSLYLTEPEFYANMAREEKECLAHLAEQNELWRLHRQMLHLTRKQSRVRQAADEAAYQAILDTPVLQAPPREGQFLARMLHQKIHGAFQLAKGDFATAWATFHRLMQAWDHAPRQIEVHPELYISTFNNYLNACLWTKGHHHDFLETVKKVRQQPGLKPGTRLHFQRITYLQELLFHLNFRPYPEGRTLTLELEEWMQTNAAAIGPAGLLLFSYNITQFLFLHGKFRKANRWLNQILNFPKGKARPDIVDFARVFQVLLQFELGNFDVQEYRLRSVKRSFHRQGKHYEMESAVLGFLSAVTKAALPDGQIASDRLHQLKTELQEIQQKPGERPPLGLQELLIWVESKLEQQPLGDYWFDIVQNNLQNASA